MLGCEHFAASRLINPNPHEIRNGEQRALSQQEVVVFPHALE